MAIYTKYGAVVASFSRLATVADVAKFENRRATRADKARIAESMYVVAVWPQGGEFLADCAMFKADGGWAEIDMARVECSLNSNAGPLAPKLVLNVAPPRPEFSKVWVQHHWVKDTSRNPTGAALVGTRRTGDKNFVVTIRPLDAKQARALAEVFHSAS